MYSLVVWQSWDKLVDRSLSVPVSRFLEYTEAVLKAPLQTLSSDALASLAKCPMLVMKEGLADEEAYIAFAESI